MPGDDINFFTPKFLHHVLHPAALHAHAGAYGINVGII